MAGTHSLLVVDDEEVVCQACRRIFSRQGFEVVSNTDARQGLTVAAERDFDIILLDIKMPNMDGIQFLEQLRERKPDVPVLIITGYPSIPNASAAMRLGACDYVTKPFTTEEITSAVQRVLSTRRAEEEGRRRGGRGTSGCRSSPGGCGDRLLGRMLVPVGSGRIGDGRRRSARLAGRRTDRMSACRGLARCCIRGCRWGRSRCRASRWRSSPRRFPESWWASTNCCPSDRAGWPPIPAGTAG